MSRGNDQMAEFRQHQDVISGVRHQMDRKTAKIVRLVADRTVLAGIVHDLKRDLNLPVHHPEREAEVIKETTRLAVAAGLTEEDGKELAKLLMTIAMRDKE
jgi:chorismate mutase